jgi:hypothetical protein
MRRLGEAMAGLPASVKEVDEIAFRSGLKKIGRAV